MDDRSFCRRFDPTSRGTTQHIGPKKDKSSDRRERTVALSRHTLVPVVRLCTQHSNLHYPLGSCRLLRTGHRRCLLALYSHHGGAGLSPYAGTPFSRATPSSEQSGHAGRCGGSTARAARSGHLHHAPCPPAVAGICDQECGRPTLQREATLREATRAARRLNKI